MSLSRRTVAPAETSETYILDYIREEFRRHPEVRIRSILSDGERGISVKTEAREYFFPLAWAQRKDFTSIQALVRKIREGLQDFD